jgi:hypothetical protein
LLSFWPPECGTVDGTLAGPSYFARASDKSRREMMKALNVATRSRVRIRTPHAVTEIMTDPAPRECL